MFPEEGVLCTEQPTGAKFVGCFIEHLASPSVDSSVGLRGVSLAGEVTMVFEVVAAVEKIPQ